MIMSAGSETMPKRNINTTHDILLEAFPKLCDTKKYIGKF